MTSVVKYLLCSLLFLNLSACASQQKRIEHTYISANSLEGPDLFIVGEYVDIPVQGTMNRTAMVGLGTLTIHSLDSSMPFSCTAELNTVPGAKGRISGVLSCTSGEDIAFVLRNLGPDQGIGIGKTTGKEKILSLFYHSSLEEAQRRFPEEKIILLSAYAQLGKAKSK